MSLDCRFNIGKFDEVFFVALTKDMVAELHECLSDFEDFDDFPHLASFRRQLRGILQYRGRSTVPVIKRRRFEGRRDSIKLSNQERFDNAWKVMASEGECDQVGSPQYIRLKEEYLKSGSSEEVTDFIFRAVNDDPNMEEQKAEST